jgi:uncharacterized membrane protein
MTNTPELSISSARRHLLPGMLAAAFASVLLLARGVVTGHLGYGFLIWNLFLAWVPLGFAGLAESDRRCGGGKWRLVPVLGMWLLFLPNAPYIVTDLVHVRGPHDASYWCDLVMVLSFAFAGMLAGIASMRLVRTTVTAIASPAVAQLLIIGSAILCGVGIYLGRVLRWNSWDVLTSPHELLPQIGQVLIDPWSYRHAAVVSLVFGAMFAIIYLAAEFANGRGQSRDMIAE